MEQKENKKVLNKDEEFIAFILQNGIDVEALRNSSDHEDYCERCDICLEYNEWCWLKNLVEGYDKSFKGVKVKVPNDYVSMESLEREYF